MAVTAADREWVRRFVTERWGASEVVSRGVRHDAATLPGLLALDGAGAPAGLLTYHESPAGLEIVSLDAVRRRAGAGTALLDAVDAVAAGRRVWLITTNDNLDALRFYQRRGFRLLAVHRDAVTAARELKPAIPLTGEYGIPLRDEIEMEREIRRKGPADPPYPGR